MLLAFWVATDLVAPLTSGALAYADLSSIVDRSPDFRLGPLKDTDKIKVAAGSHLGR
jgi:hypothetical protein